MTIKRILGILLLISMILAAAAYADTITLKSGRVVEGKIIEQTEDHVKVDYNDVALTFYQDEIEKIEKGKAS